MFTHHPLLTQRFDQALALAAELHRDQTRKGTEVPYLSHLMAVAGLVLETRAYRACDHLEDLAIAALLHDAVEDQGHRITLAQIRERFGDRVHDIVAACTDAVVTKEGQEKPPWRVRKQAYLASIPGKSGDALVVSCADKLHNARSILFDHDWIGDKIWERFNPTRDETLWYYEGLAEAFEAASPDNPLLPEFKAAVRRMREIVQG